MVQVWCINVKTEHGTLIMLLLSGVCPEVGREGSEGLLTMEYEHFEFQV